MTDTRNSLPTKVTLEVTANWYTWRVINLDNKVIAEKTMKRLTQGGAQGDMSDFDARVNDDDLLEAIDDSDAYAIMTALSMLE